jgi:predicted SPOUT superfamily RNA methylase MTH1
MVYYGYVYKTTNLITNKFYIGKKAYLHKKRKKLTKKELALIKTKGRKPVYKVEYVDSDWKNYYGSSVELKADIEKFGKENFKVEKLMDCPTKKSLSYWETHYQFMYDVLRCDTYNGNILGRFYRKDIN